MNISFGASFRHVSDTKKSHPHVHRPPSANHEGKTHLGTSHIEYSEGCSKLRLGAEFAMDGGGERKREREKSLTELGIYAAGAFFSRLRYDSPTPKS